MRDINGTNSSVSAMDANSEISLDINREIKYGPGPEDHCAFCGKRAVFVYYR